MGRDTRRFERLVALVLDVALHSPDATMIRAAARIACRAYRAGVSLTRRELGDAALRVAWLRDYTRDPLRARAPWWRRFEGARALGEGRAFALRSLAFDLRVSCGRLPLGDLRFGLCPTRRAEVLAC